MYQLLTCLEFVSYFKKEDDTYKGLASEVTCILCSGSSISGSYLSSSFALRWFLELQ